VSIGGRVGGEVDGEGGVDDGGRRGGIVVGAGNLHCPGGCSVDCCRDSSQPS